MSDEGLIPFVDSANATPRLGAQTLETTGTNNRLHTRRQIVRQGIKLAFTAPLITTFLASDAHAAASRQSCYPAGHVCDLPGQQESCCNGACAGGVCP